MSFQEALTHTTPIKTLPKNPAVIFIDAGVSTTRVVVCDSDSMPVGRMVLPSNQDIIETVKAIGLDSLGDEIPVYITGKLQTTLQQHIGRGELIQSSAALWSAAQNLVAKSPLAILELSASGYMAVGVAPNGELHEDMLTVNPRCGAGSGVNLDRVLQKLNMRREAVDGLLEEYCGIENRERRKNVHIRADRCGVFASSATISDKNQGIPLDFALAVTMKSEVLKACKKLTGSFDTVWLTGGIFMWQFARDCASDYLETIGIKDIRFDQNNSLPIVGLLHLSETIGAGNFSQPDRRVISMPKPSEYPALRTLKEDLEKESLYTRLANVAPSSFEGQALIGQKVMIGLDVGSTMAKLIISAAESDHILYKGSYSNAGDTIDTIKEIFRDIQAKDVHELNIVQIGLTGSARYQVKKALINIYPDLADRVSVLVENYAHASGSIDYAKAHVEQLKAKGVTDINESFCLLVDIGGEDTKISSISLQKGELFDNAMNVKCSAGTGSLMDTLTSMFFLDDIAKACGLAMQADRSYAINATCAVFLMENARKLQAEGYGNDEILASANWAIVENMARTLWNQIELLPNTVVLLHGQTMLSDPLPVAVAQRMQSYVGKDMYCLVPPDPGHRACIGLIESLQEMRTASSIPIHLDEFVTKEYSKKIIQCQGVACGDPDALCNRSRLTGAADCGQTFSFNLGGCTAINELQATKGVRSQGSKDTYKMIWDYIDERLPHSDDPGRLVIPRSFAVSEWAMFFSALFTPLGIPVHVDNLHPDDIPNAQPHFHIDTCAPHIGVVGQFLRIASEPHGMILAPQIEFLPIKNRLSIGRTCTINQGGLAVAKSIAEAKRPDTKIHLFYLELLDDNPIPIAEKIYPRLREVFDHYGVTVNFEQFFSIVRDALDAQHALKEQAGDYAAELANKALDEGRDVAVVLGREYILNPGIYDSHVGRLLRDKNIAGIPSYLLDGDFSPKFKHLYWRNPHMLATLADASSRRELYKVTAHEGLKKVFRRIELEKEAYLPTVQVSTFLCGPDSVTNPLISELTKHRPFLLIQSDAVIKELAHLENRMNTYVKQLESDLHTELAKSKAEGFDVEVLDKLVLSSPIDPQRDAIYFPTLSDNRYLTSVVRAGGFTCIDLYSDDYDLQEAITSGRSASGDTVCAPLAAVYGDVIAAIEDFRWRKQNDPAFAHKERLLMFNNKGLGPCRQGQYVETHKIFINKQQSEGDNKMSDDAVFQFLVSKENAGFDTGFPKWVYLRGVQCAALQGVMHQLLADGASQCADYEEYQAFMDAYRELKEELFDTLENKITPSPRAHKLSQLFSKLPGLNYLVNYFVYGLHKNTLTKPLKAFAGEWCSRPLQGNPTTIHIDGEAYMRVAQYEDIHKTLLATLGFRQFRLTHTPVWSFLDYKLAGMLMRAREAIDETTRELKETKDKAAIKAKKKYRFSKRKRLLGLQVVHFVLRSVIAQPLYKAANAVMPAPMPHALDVAESVISTKRPGGELVPYVGEAVEKLREGYDLVLNVAPEGCMVSSMGEAITPGIYAAAPNSSGKLQHLFSQQGDVDEELIQIALLKTIGPVRFYRSAEVGA